VAAAAATTGADTSTVAASATNAAAGATTAALGALTSGAAAALTAAAATSTSLAETASLAAASVTTGAAAAASIAAAGASTANAAATLAAASTTNALGTVLAAATSNAAAVASTAGGVISLTTASTSIDAAAIGAATSIGAVLSTAAAASGTTAAAAATTGMPCPGSNPGSPAGLPGTGNPLAPLAFAAPQKVIYNVSAIPHLNGVAAPGTGYEPRAMRCPSDGTVWVCGDYGGGMGNAVYKSTDNGQTFSLMGFPDMQALGGNLGYLTRGAGFDCALACSDRPGTVYFGSTTETNYPILGSTHDGGATWQVTATPLGITNPTNDRIWLVGVGQDTVVMMILQNGLAERGAPEVIQLGPGLNFTLEPQSEQVYVNTQGAAVSSQWSQIASPTTWIDGTVLLDAGRLVYDRSNNYLYVTANRGSYLNATDMITVSRSTDFGATWQQFVAVPEADLVPGTVAWGLPWLTLESSSGVLYLVHSDGAGVFVATSTDFAQTWMPRTQVDDGSGIAFMPAAVGGRNNSVGVV
jgi:hypothetical protein